MPSPIRLFPASRPAGTVEEVGDGVTAFVPGDRVATTEGEQSYAQFMVLDAEKALPVPDTVSDDVAAALTAQGITATI